ncbi:MAG TPA: hypothetical protein VIH71_10830 [Solirubrobacteraceae bacterium]
MPTYQARPPFLRDFKNWSREQEAFPVMGTGARVVACISLAWL